MGRWSGPRSPSHHYPDLTALDGDDNVVATVHMNDHDATIAEQWFGVPSSSVISGGAPLTGITDT